MPTRPTTKRRPGYGAKTPRQARDGEQKSRSQPNLEWRKIFFMRRSKAPSVLALFGRRVGTASFWKPVWSSTNEGEQRHGEAYFTHLAIHGTLECGAMKATVLDVLVEAESWRKAGRGVALATVVETWGSAPWPVGSHLAVDEAGLFLGSVSGGCVEGEVVTTALDVIADGAPRLIEFGVADETVWRTGLSCGGRIAVYIERID